jgi:hypothetical protein
MASDIFFLAQRIAKGGAAAKPHVTKAELYQALQAGAAKIQKAGETDAQAFARFATEHPDGQVLMQAHQLANGADYAPERVQKAAPPQASTDGAYATFMTKVQELRRERPDLTEGMSDAQVFAKLYENPANIDLAKAERTANRPSLASPDGAHAPLARRAEPPMTVSLKLLYGMADDLRTKEPKLTEAQAFSRVLDTPQGRKLYQQHRSEQISG